MENARCCFVGHRDTIMTDEIRIKLRDSAENLIVNHNVRKFFVGNYGGFDKGSAFVISELKAKYPDIELELVLPYLTKEIIENKYVPGAKYDSILLADIPEKTPKRYHIIKCNEYMVNNSDYIICYIIRSWGGANATLNYAKQRKKQIINIAEFFS
ncbi:MAG: hypothetical protein E7411_03005 [Ruminococcaceae bacterium]|nr:hypothetical protein [Oscillospiraceae bacterium]